MSYASKEEIKSMFRDFASNTDAAVSDTEIDAFLLNSDSMINAKIGTLYTLPITLLNNPESFAILKQLQMFSVAAIVDDILNSYGEADKKPSWNKNGRDMMEDLVPKRSKTTGKQSEPTMKLPDATYTGTSTQRGRIKLSATSGTVFKKGVDTW